MKRDVILWILADELRADALSCYGAPHPRIRTPNIDALADRGVLFEEAYTASPVCVPARVSMATGLRPDQSGVWGNEAYTNGYPLLDGLVTFTEHLAQSGWQTCSFGKEHVPPALQPWQLDDHHGADMREIRAGAEQRTVVSTPGTGTVVAGTWPDDRPYPSDAITASVVEAIRSAERPLLVRASYLQPHTPVVVPEPWASRYADIPFESRPGLEPVDTVFERRFAEISRGREMTAEGFRKALVAYHGAVAWLDEQVGVLMRALDETPGLGRVMVIFTSDHGAHLGEDGSYGKHTFAPASHRIPLIIAGDDVCHPGSRRVDLASNADVARTALAAARVPVPDSIGGRDLLHDDPPTEHISGIGYGAAASRAFPNHGTGTISDGTGWPQRICVRTDRYRLDMTTRVDGRTALPHERDIFLADRIKDPAERMNVSGRAEYEAVERELVARAATTAAQAMRPPDGEIYSRFAPPAPLPRVR
ncbi:sulfatase-like hydrolase/transferase [Saccharomonospora sp. NPDC046836]|uniref:sulfatase-like hydrolase/transferase n=1 Tax=Saccharomonospora sp. NPDC046836 TaxID=3156921 RepID=UPI0033CCC064